MKENNGKVHDKSFVIFGADVQIINAVERMLLFAGAHVQAATTAKDGLAKVINARPDVVIIDDTLADMKMTEVISTLQSNGLTKLIPVIIITTTGVSDDYKKLFLVGEQHYLVRSEFDVMSLVLLIESILRNINNDGSIEIFDFSEINSITKDENANQVRLLVIEDDPLLRNLLSIRLEKSGITHQFCHSGDKAMSQIINFKPSVVILDLMLPGKNGMAVLEEIRQSAETKDLPIIIFSNKDDDVERIRAKALGVNDFLIKATTDLSTLIAKILTHTQSR